MSKLKTTIAFHVAPEDLPDTAIDSLNRWLTIADAAFNTPHEIPLVHINGQLFTPRKTAKVNPDITLQTKLFEV